MSGGSFWNQRPPFKGDYGKYEYEVKVRFYADDPDKAYEAFLEAVEAHEVEVHLVEDSEEGT